MKALVSIGFLTTILSFCPSGWVAQKALSASPRSEGSWLSASQRGEIDRLFAPQWPRLADAWLRRIDIIGN